MRQHPATIDEPETVRGLAGIPTERRQLNVYDDTLALLLAEVHPDMRDGGRLGGWLVYDGTRYMPDETAPVFQRI